MTTAAELKKYGLRRCRCGGVRHIFPDSFREELRASRQDPASLDRCLACEQHTAIQGAHKANRVFSLEEFDYMLGLAGRNAGPNLLYTARMFNVIASATITALTADVWSGAEYPQNYLRQIEWLELFSAAGFTVDGRPAERPADPVKLWRGCVPSRRRRMSWTADRELAQRYADGIAYRAKGIVFETIVPAASLLCINDLSRGESEYVINTLGLKIREAPDLA